MDLSNPEWDEKLSAAPGKFRELKRESDGNASGENGLVEHTSRFTNISIAKDCSRKIELVKLSNKRRTP